MEQGDLTAPTGAEHLGRGLAYRDEVPLAWELLDEEPSSGHIAVIHAGNERLLRHIASLDDYRHEPEDEDLAGLGPGLSRIEFKLNILMDMMAELVGQHMTLPPQRSIQLSSDALSWRLAADERIPEAGQRLTVRIYLNRQYPRALELHGTVTVADARAGQVHMQCDPLPDSLQDMLDKLIFRQHRRLISQRHQHD